MAESQNTILVSNSRLGNLGDIAFWGDLAAIGTGIFDGREENDGFVLVDVGDPAAPQEVARFTCPTTGFDVSIWKHLVVLSSSLPSGAQLARCSSIHPSFRPPESMTADVLVVDISNPRDPKLLAAADTPCDVSHTHTIIPDEPNERLVVWNSGASCVAPLEISLPRPSDVKTYPQLEPWGDTTAGKTTGAKPSCHDITVFLPANVAACATSPFQSLGPGTQFDGEAGTELWDITDPLRPRFISRIQNPAIEHQHSTAFSWDGKTLVLGEEKLSTFFTETSTCGTETPMGALWFYDITNPASPQLKSWYQLPRPTADGYCSAHYFSVVPLSDGRDVLTSGWYSGGTTVVDFTDSSNPQEIAHFKAASAPGDRKESSFVYSAYWYNGFVYATNLGGHIGGESAEVLGSRRGLDVLSVDHPSLATALEVPYLNAQTQMGDVGPGRNETGPARLGVSAR